MKLLLESWKNYLTEGPLYDIGDYESPSGNEYTKKSVGYGMTKTPSFVKRVKEVMSKTGDNWVVISINNVENAKQEIKSPAFKAWIKSKKYPKDSKIIVIGSSPQEGDYNSAEWFLHDILGHTIGDQFFLANSRGLAKNANQWLSNTTDKTRTEVVDNLIPLLSSDVSPVPATEKLDKVYDIFGSIVMGYITLSEAIAAMTSDEQREIVRLMFAVSNNWVENIKPNTPTIIKPW